MVKKVLSCFLICWGLSSFVSALFRGYESIPLLLSAMITRALMLALILTVIYLLRSVDKLTRKLDILNDQLDHYMNCSHSNDQTN